MFFGGILGVVVGGMFGFATFGGVGAIAGAVIGGGIGHMTFALFRAGDAMNSAAKPLTVLCPDTGESATVRVDTRSAVWSALTPTRANVVACSRYRGEPRCNHDCERDLDI